MSEYQFPVGFVLGGEFEVLKALGSGGFGHVYLVHARHSDHLYALKMLHPQLTAAPPIVERFTREANIWINLDRHPYIVRAHFVERFENQIGIGLEYVGPSENGHVTLSDYLVKGPDLQTCLRWAIQFCEGMIYANSKGMVCHRDIKPQNILIGTTGTVKITDFGLAALSRDDSQQRIDGKALPVALENTAGTVLGTPAYMAPEQFVGPSTLDVRRDIYSFGIVLYQMANQGRLPFAPPKYFPGRTDEIWQRYYELHQFGSIPPCTSPLYPIITRCLSKSPSGRFPEFTSLQRELCDLMQSVYSERFVPPPPESFEGWEWSNKGGSLITLGRYKDALDCLNKATDAAPYLPSAWSNKGAAYRLVEEYVNGISCFSEALAIDPAFALAWSGLSRCHQALGDLREALRCVDQAIVKEPRNASFWSEKGMILIQVNDCHQAEECLRKAISLDSRDANTWFRLSICLQQCGRVDEALDSVTEALSLEPANSSFGTLQATLLSMAGRIQEALQVCVSMLKMDPRAAGIWFTKGMLETDLGRHNDSQVSLIAFLRHADPNKDADKIEFARSSLQSLKVGENSRE